MEPLSTTFAKAVDDMSAKIFVPALISSLFVECGPWLQTTTGLGFFPTYLIILFAGTILAALILLGLMEISILLFKGRVINAEVGVAMMPLGFAGLFPNHFSVLEIPYSQVTGIAILAWSFMLLKDREVFSELL